MNDGEKNLWPTRPEPRHARPRHGFAHLARPLQTPTPAGVGRCLSGALSSVEVPRRSRYRSPAGKRRRGRTPSKVTSASLVVGRSRGRTRTDAKRADEARPRSLRGTRRPREASGFRSGAREVEHHRGCPATCKAKRQALGGGEAWPILRWEKDRNGRDCGIPALEPGEPGAGQIAAGVCAESDLDRAPRHTPSARGVSPSNVAGRAPRPARVPAQRTGA